MIVCTLFFAVVWWMLELESIHRECMMLFTRDDLSRMPATRERLRRWQVSMHQVDYND